MEIVVPGSVANLGGGFDTLAVAVQLYLRVRIVDVRDDGGATLKVAGCQPPVSGENAVERAYAALARQSGRRIPSVVVDVQSDIPMAAGLGSSAAAAVAGIRVFEHVTAPMSEPALLAAATALEGHPDNAAAALFGGLTSVVDDRLALRWHWPDDLRLVIATPGAELATASARAALPPALPRADAVFNLQRVLAFVHALQHGDYGRLREAVQDRWHQPARMALVPQLEAALAIEDPEVFGAFLSGAGPSVALLARRDFGRIQQRLEEIYERAGSPVTVRTLAVHQSSQVMPAALVAAHGRSV
jgi:homoserine kinase